MGQYFTIGTEAEVSLKREGSNFIAMAAPVFSQIVAEGHIIAVRKKYFNATHHCYAYAVGEDRALFHYSDDGEPSGTAGVKIFSALLGSNLSDIIVIVTRYFGGTKLGVGGLGRAYRDAAEAVVAHVPIVRRIPAQQITATVSYSYITPVMSMVQKMDAYIEKTVYAEAATFLITVPVMATDELKCRLVELTNGTADIIRGACTVRSVKV